MSKLILKNKTFFKTDKHSTRRLKQDFIDYCLDLHQIEGGYLEFRDQRGLSFSELLDQFLLAHPELISSLTMAELILLIHTDYEYNPDYSHISAYFENSVKPLGKIFSFSAPKEVLLKNACHLLENLLEEGQVGVILHFQHSCRPLCNRRVKLQESFNAGVSYYKYTYL